ncbi:MAG: antirestriction protein ArdA [Oscillospiraceae bacterium]|nr:antirestriction protein ArdA [Oscillospiraceae bacterium]
MNLYLSQIAKWIENETGKPQQIIHTNEKSEVSFIDHDSYGMGMTLIADADIAINSVSWSDEFGLGLNTANPSNENGEKAHVILWTDMEVQKDERGFYMDSEGALNGVLVLYNPKTEVTEDVIKEMLALEEATPLLGDKIQSLMDEFYSEWQKEENKGKSRWDVLSGFSEAHQIAVVFGNFNYQVGNGGISQWVYNGYFHDDAEKFTEYLETGAKFDERCRTILDKVYTLDQYAEETDSDRYGSFYDPDNDGDSSFIGDMIDGDAFDTWYYAHCDKEDWWKAVSDIIDKTMGHELAPAGQDERGEGAAGTKPTLQVYIENVHDDSIGGFTMPLPATPEMFQKFFDGAEITGWQDLEIVEVYSDIGGLGETLTETIKKTMSQDTLDELNYLAARIGGLSENGREVFSAAVESGRHCGSVAEMMNLSSPANLDNFYLQPAYDAKQYGDFLLDMQKDDTAEFFQKLEKSENPDVRAFAQYILRLEAYIDPAAFGRGAAKEENGAFTEHGYLTEAEDKFQTLYHGSQDVPAEYRILTQPGEVITPPIKIADVDIAATLVKIHAACCVGMSGAADSLKMLIGDYRPYGDFLLLVNKERVSLFHPLMAYERGGLTEKTVRHWAEMPDTKFFNVRVNDRGDNTGRDMRGDFIELNTNALLTNMARHTVMPERIEAIRHDGFSKSYDLVAWAEVSQSRLSEIKDVKHHYPLDGLVEASKRYEDFVGANEISSDARGFDDYFPVLCAPYMTAAANPQPDMIRVTNEAAKEILARGDADVYRLIPGGAEKLAQIEALRPMCFAEYSDLAIKREDAAGLDKWAARAVKNIQRQANRAEHKQTKHKGEEL